MLLDLIGTRGPSSETYGLLGRVYKDRWEAALKQGEKFLARGLLDKAIDAYREGLRDRLARRLSGHQRRDADGRCRTRPIRAREQLLPVVRYAVERKIASGQARLLGPRDAARARRAGEGRERRHGRARRRRCRSFASTGSRRRRRAICGSSCGARGAKRDPPVDAGHRGRARAEGEEMSAPLFRAGTLYALPPHRGKRAAPPGRSSAPARCLRRRCGRSR